MCDYLKDTLGFIREITEIHIHIYLFRVVGCAVICAFVLQGPLKLS